MPTRTRKPKKVEPEYAERPKEFRHRAIQWVLAVKGPLPISDLVLEFSQQFPDYMVTKEVLFIDLKILLERGLVEKWQHEEDRRIVLWGIV